MYGFSLWEGTNIAHKFRGERFMRSAIHGEALVTKTEVTFGMTVLTI